MFRMALAAAAIGWSGAAVAGVTVNGAPVGETLVEPNPCAAPAEISPEDYYRLIGMDVEHAGAEISLPDEIYIEHPLKDDELRGPFVGIIYDRASDEARFADNDQPVAADDKADSSDDDESGATPASDAMPAPCLVRAQ